MARRRSERRRALRHRHVARSLRQPQVVHVASVVPGGLHRGEGLAHAVHDDHEAALKGRLRDRAPHVRQMVRELKVRYAWKQVVV